MEFQRRRHHRDISDIARGHGAERITHNIAFVCIPVVSGCQLIGALLGKIAQRRDRLGALRTAYHFEAAALKHKAIGAVGFYFVDFRKVAAGDRQLSPDLDRFRTRFADDFAASDGVGDREITLDTDRQIAALHRSDRQRFSCKVKRIRAFGKGETIV